MNNTNLNDTLTCEVDDSNVCKLERFKAPIYSLLSLVEELKLDETNCEEDLEIIRRAEVALKDRLKLYESTIPASKKD